LSLEAVRQEDQPRAMKDLTKWKVIEQLAATTLALTLIAPAQSVPSANAGRANPLPHGTYTTQPRSTAPVLLIASYQRYSSLRRGREQEMAVVICMVPAKYQYCADFGSPGPWDRFAPVSFALDPQPGFTVRYREGNAYRNQLRGKLFESGNKQVVLFKIRAAKDAPLGARVLQGELIFRKGDQGPGGVWAGNGTLEKIEIKVPVAVAGHDDVVMEAATWPKNESFGRKTTRNAQNILAMVPSLAFDWLICQFGDCDCIKHE